MYAIIKKMLFIFRMELLLIGLVIALLIAKKIDLVLLVWNIFIAIAIGSVANLTDGFNLYTASILYIVPAGSFAAGAISAMAFNLISKSRHYRPKGNILINSLVISMFAYLVVDLIIYGGFADPAIRGISLNSNFVPVGFWFGWLFTISEVIAFSLALGGGLLLLESELFCDKCNKYFEKSFKQTRFSSNDNGFAELLDQLMNLISDHKYAEAVQHHTDNMGDNEFHSNSKNDKKCDLDLRQCPSCSIKNLAIDVYDIEVKTEDENGKEVEKINWIKCNDKSISVMLDANLDLSKVVSRD